MSLQNVIRAMNTEFTKKADTSADLVSNEKYLEDSKTQKRNEIISQYKDLVDWLVMFHKHPYIDLAEDSIKQIHMAYQFTNKIQNSLDQQEINLKQQRDDIEGRLQKETRQFVEELNSVKNDVDKFKDNAVKKKEDEYNKNIDKINKQLV